MPSPPDLSIKSGQHVLRAVMDDATNRLRVDADISSGSDIDVVLTTIAANTAQNLRQQILNSEDLVSTYSWDDFGTLTQRIASIVYTSATYSGSTLTRTFNYTNISGAYRLDSSTWVIS